MKKIIYICLSALLIIITVTGCSLDNTVPTNSPSAFSPTPSATSSDPSKLDLSQFIFSEEGTELQTNWLENVFIPQWYASSDWSTPIVEDNDVCYYICSEGIRCRYTKENKERLIIKSSNVVGLILHNGELYFNYNETHIIRYSKNQTLEEIWNVSESCVADNDQAIYDFCFGDNGNILLYNTPISIIEIDPETRKSTVLLDDCSSFSVLNKGIYFIEHSSRDFAIMFKDHETKAVSSLRYDTSHSDRYDPLKIRYDNVVAFQGNVYYTIRTPIAKLCKLSGSPDTDEVIFDGCEGCQIKHVSNDSLFFVAKKQNEDIYTLYSYKNEKIDVLLSQAKLDTLIFTDKNIYYLKDEQVNDSPILTQINH